MAEVSETGQELALVSPSDIVFCDPGDDAVLSCHLKPAISADSMEIKWWNKTDLVCHYKNRRVTVSRHYKDQASFSLRELCKGNVSLTLRDVRESQRGIYICEVIHGHQTIKEYIFLHICSQDFKLVVPTDPVCTDSGSDIILRAHLLPETNAVSMDIRWFKGAELIYHYKNGREMTNNDYRNRVSLSTQELRRGNLTLCLRNVNQSDSGDYKCKLFHDRFQKTGVIHLQVNELQKRKHTCKSKHLAGELTFKKKKTNYGGTYTEERKYNVGERMTYTQAMAHTIMPERYNRWLMRQEYQLREQDILHSYGLTTKRRRRNSMDGVRPSMSNDSTLEKPEIEKKEPRAIAGKESGHQNTREWNTATGQKFSSTDTSSQVLGRLRKPKLVTSVGNVHPITPETLTIPFLSMQPQVQVRPLESLTAGHMRQTFEKMLEDREQSSLKSTVKKMPNYVINKHRTYAAAATTTTTTTDLTKTKTGHF